MRGEEQVRGEGGVARQRARAVDCAGDFQAGGRRLYESVVAVVGG